MRGTMSCFFFVTAIPRRVTFPDVGVRIVSMTSTVVVLPAPFGPRKANTSPLLTVNDMSLTASKSPYRFVSLSTSIAYSVSLVMNLHLSARPRQGGEQGCVSVGPGPEPEVAEDLLGHRRPRHEKTVNHRLAGLE